MITNLIVGLSVAFAVALLLANWLVPALRRHIEQPKYTFQEQLHHFDSHQLDSHQFDQQRQDTQAKASDLTTGSTKERSDETR